MSRDDLHFRLRLPANLKASIEKEAKSRSTSMTAVIVARLENTQDTLTIRDQFAMAALTGLMSAHASDGSWSTMGAIDEAAKFSYAAADAMLEARKAVKE